MQGDDTDTSKTHNIFPSNSSPLSQNKNVKQPNFRMEARVVTWRKNGKILLGQEPRYHPSFAQINNLLDNIFLSATYQTLTELSTDIISGTRGLM